MVTPMLYRMLFLLTNVGKVWVFLGGRPSACHSIPPTFPQEIPRKTHTFPPLVNKNIPHFSLDYVDAKLKNSIAEEICAAFLQVIWKILPPGSPWRSGRAEAMVKQVKHSLKCLLTKMLSLMEFHCVLQEITTTINNWPISRFNGMDVLTPNMLILGRNYTSSPQNIEEFPVANIPLGLRQYVKDVYSI